MESIKSTLNEARNTITDKVNELTKSGENTSATNQSEFDQLDAQKMSELQDKPIQPGTQTTSSSVKSDSEMKSGKDGNYTEHDRVDEGSNESFPSSDAPASHRSV